MGILFAPDSAQALAIASDARLMKGRDLVNAKADEGREYLKRQGARLVDQTNEFVECANGS